MVRDDVDIDCQHFQMDPVVFGALGVISCGLAMSLFRPERDPKATDKQKEAGFAAAERLLAKQRAELQGLEDPIVESTSALEISPLVTRPQAEERSPGLPPLP